MKYLWIAPAVTVVTLLSATAARCEDNRFATNIVAFDFGDESFAIPRNYFFHLPTIAEYLGPDMRFHPSDDREERNFTLRVLLPDLEPRTASNWETFDVHTGWDSQVSLYVKIRGHLLSGKSWFDAFYRSRNAEITRGPFGFQKFDWVNQDFLFKGPIDRPTDVVSCDRPGDVPFPSCKRLIRIAPEIVLQYTFARKYLAETSAIDAQLIGLLNGFLVRGPALKLIE